MPNPDQTNQDAVNDSSALEMSDEDFLKLGPAGFAAPTQTELTEQPVGTAAAAPSTDDDEASEEAAAESAATALAVSSGTDQDPASGQDAAAGAERSDDAEAEADAAAAKADPAAKTEPPAAIDYQAEYEKLFKPFKANGREIQLTSVEDVVALMQMGANYNKKMAALKPNMKVLKLLENHGLLDEGKLSYLIDLDKKNPAAINKLVKESGLDPVADLDPGKASEYKHTTYTVDEREIALDTVLDDIKESPTYNQVLEVVSNKWDQPSKALIADSPEVLKVINDHMQSGIYPLIANEMERERMLGRLKGLSDLEAYRKVGDAIHARGGFNHLVSGSPRTQEQPAAAAPVVTSPPPSKADDDKRNDKRRAASSARPAATPRSTLPADFNPLAMSDEEFQKQGNPKFL
jgi:hypothetical protein